VNHLLTMLRNTKPAQDKSSKRFQVIASALLGKLQMVRFGVNQGLFANEGTLGGKANDFGDFEIQNSSATGACGRIGGYLPSIEQYRILADFFADTADFETIFPLPTSGRNLFWTLNGRPGNFARFARLSPFLDPYGDIQLGTKQLSVICRHDAE
jgi:hypothetical protein